MCDTQGRDKWYSRDALMRLLISAADTAVKTRLNVGHAEMTLEALAQEAGLYAV